jgi:hypothetical protein
MSILAEFIKKQPAIFLRSTLNKPIYYLTKFECQIQVSLENKEENLIAYM